MSKLQLHQIFPKVTLVLVQLTMRLVVICGFGINLMHLPTEDKSQVTCTLGLLRKYFDYGDALSGSILCMSITPYNRDVQERLLFALNQHEDYPWTLLTTKPQDKRKSHSEPKVMHEKPQCYFIVVGDLVDEDLEETFENWKTMASWNPFAQFVVFLAAVEETDEEMTDLMVELLLTFMNNKVYNVNVIGQSEENSFYYAKTVFPYHPDNNCGNRVIAIDLLDVCSHEEDEKDEEEEDDDSEENLETENEKVNDEDKKKEEEKSLKNLESEDDEGEGREKEIQKKGKENLEPSVKEENKEVEVTVTDLDSISADENSPMESITEVDNSDKSNKIEVQQYMRASSADKFPHDLSGCPIRAAYRGSWEPYIFSIISPTETEDYQEAAAKVANNSDSSYDDSYIDEEYNNVEQLDSNNGEVEEPMGQTKLTGLEYQLIETIAQRLHVTIDFTMQSSNVFHLFQQLIEGKIDVIVGGIDEDPSISQVVSSSTSYHQDELTWCVARAKRKHSFFNFLAGFNTYAWILLLIFIISSSFAVLAAQKVSGFRLNSLPNYFSITIRMLGILLTQSINVDAQTMPIVLRLLFALAFYMAFFFSNTYQSFLISTLTTPTTQAQISHLEEIYDNRMTILVSSENVRHLDKDGETFKYIREKFQICYNIVDCLNNAADNEHIAVAVSRQHAFYNARIQRDKLFCFDRRESLYVYPVAMLLPKKFQLLQQINDVIQNVIESGHMQKWARDLDMVRLIHEKIASAQEDDFKPLNLSQFHGAFAFASALLLLASIVFGLECLVYWSVIRKRTRLRPLRCLHRRFRQS